MAEFALAGLKRACSLIESRLRGNFVQIATGRSPDRFFSFLFSPARPFFPSVRSSFFAKKNIILFRMMFYLQLVLVLKKALIFRLYSL